MLMLVMFHSSVTVYKRVNPVQTRLRADFSLVARLTRSLTLFVVGPSPVCRRMVVDGDSG